MRAGLVAGNQKTNVESLLRFHCLDQTRAAQSPLGPPHRPIAMKVATTQCFVVARRNSVSHYAHMRSSPCPGIASRIQ